MESHNMVFTSFFLIMAIFLQVIGGLSIITSYKSKIGAINNWCFNIDIQQRK